MLNNTLYIQDKNYEGIKDNLISLLNTVLDDNKRANIGTIDDLRKTSIAIKAFDLVSFSMSLFAYVQYKTHKLSYYKTLAILNDAKYLANSSES